MNIVGPIPDHVLRLMSPEDKPKGISGMTLAEIHSKSEVEWERKLHDQVLSYLSVLDIFVGHSRMDKKSTYTEGWPDIVFCYHNRAVAFELKVGNNDLSDVQKQARVKMINNGWLYWTIRNLEDVKTALRMIT